MMKHEVLRAPAGVERMAGVVDVDDQRCVIRRDWVSLPRLAIDFDQTPRCCNCPVTSR